MKKNISSVLIFAMLAANIFAQTYYENNEDESYYNVNEESFEESFEKNERGLTTGEKALVVVGVVAGKLIYDKLTESKYKKSADKAYSVIYSEQKSLEKENSPKKNESSVGKKILKGVVIGGALVGGGLWLANELSKSKYEKVADKAYKVVEETK